MSNTNSRFVQDLNRIVRFNSSTQSSLSVVQPDPIVAVRGIGEATEPKAQSVGIASPLKEISGTREYYDPEFITSSDGLFVIEQKAIKRATYFDSNGSQVVIEFEKDSN